LLDGMQQRHEVIKIEGPKIRETCNPLRYAKPRPEISVCPACGCDITERPDEYDTYDCCECGKVFEIKETESPR